MTHTPPQPSELASYSERARGSQVRIATAHGDIVFSLFPDEAPLHSAAFLKLAEAGFYDGLKFHRVEPGFVVQGGDPKGDGTGGPGYNLTAEFNTRPHLRGTVAMARSSSPDSAGVSFTSASTTRASSTDSTRCSDRCRKASMRSMRSAAATRSRKSRSNPCHPE